MQGGRPGRAGMSTVIAALDDVNGIRFDADAIRTEPEKGLIVADIVALTTQRSPRIRRAGDDLESDSRSRNVGGRGDDVLRTSGVVAYRRLSYWDQDPHSAHQKAHVPA